MNLSRRTLSFLTILVILVALSAGVVWRLRAHASESAAASAQSSDTTKSDLPVTSGSAQFSADQPQPVEGAKVVRDTLWIRVKAAGRAEAYRRASLTAQVEGVVVFLPVQENDRVGSGQRVLQLDTTEYALGVAQSRADLLKAQAAYQKAVLFDDEIEDTAVRNERARIARTTSGLDQAEVSLRQAEIKLGHTSVRAPFDGRVANLQVVQGQHVNAGADLMTVVDLDPIKVEVQVLEADIGKLTEGREARVTFAAYPNERFTGRVESINPVVDPDTRTGRVTVVLQNRDGRIKPGMYADVSLDAEAIPDRILVPRAAILERESGGIARRTMLFVFKPNPDGKDGTADWRYVNTGKENDSLVEILPGDRPEDNVQPGEIVLVGGHHYLAHGTPIRLVENVEAAGGRPGR